MKLIVLEIVFLITNQLQDYLHIRINKLNIGKQNNNLTIRR